MINYGPIKSNDTGVFECLVTTRTASRKGCKKAAQKLMNQSVGHSLAQLLKLNTMWDKILKHSQDRVGVGSLFGANY